MVYLILILCLCSSVSVYAADPVLSFPGMGVDTYVLAYPTNTNVIQMINTIGARYVRDEYNWQRAEKEKGKFIIDHRMLQYIDKLNALNIKPILILCYSNPNYSNDKTNRIGPNNAESLKQFIEYVSFMVSNFKGKVYAWEIWNEPDNQHSWKPKPNSKAYSSLVKHVAPIIRKIDPHTLIVAGAFWKPNPEFLKSLQEIDALVDVDVISFHWYTFPRPPDQGFKPNSMDLTSVRSFIQKIKSLGKRAWITELGYPTYSDAYGVSEVQQAEYLKKQLVIAANMGAEVCIIYNLIDGGLDPKNKELHFGLFRFDGTAKPAAEMLESFTK